MELHLFDEQYVRRLKAGDPDVQHHFVAYFSELTLIKLRARFLAPHVIDDLRQETFVRVLAALRGSGLEHPERLGAFVNSVCNNVLLEHYRSSTRAEGFEEGFDPPDKNIDLDRSLIREESMRTVSKILDQMPERDRKLLRAVFLEEKSKDQVCSEMGVDRDYLRVLLHRAKAHLRSKLGQREEAVRPR